MQHTSGPAVLQVVPQIASTRSWSESSARATVMPTWVFILSGLHLVLFTALGFFDDYFLGNQQVPKFLVFTSLAGALAIGFWLERSNFEKPLSGVKQKALKLWLALRRAIGMVTIAFAAFALFIWVTSTGRLLPWDRALSTIGLTIPILLFAFLGNSENNARSAVATPIERKERLRYFFFGILLAGLLAIFTRGCTFQAAEGRHSAAKEADLAMAATKRPGFPPSVASKATAPDVQLKLFFPYASCDPKVASTEPIFSVASTDFNRTSAIQAVKHLFENLPRGAAAPLIEVSGHTDRTGGSARNQRLADCRALSVRELIAALPYPRGRVAVRGVIDETDVSPSGLIEASSEKGPSSRYTLILVR